MQTAGPIGAVVTTPTVHVPTVSPALCQILYLLLASQRSWGKGSCCSEETRSVLSRWGWREVDKCQKRDKARVAEQRCVVRKEMHPAGLVGFLVPERQGGSCPGGRSWPGLAWPGKRRPHDTGPRPAPYPSSVIPIPCSPHSHASCNSVSFPKLSNLLAPLLPGLAVLGSHSSRVSYSIRTSTSCPPIGPSL